MRKSVAIGLILVVVSIFSATLFAQSTDRDGQVRKGDLAVEIGAGFGAHGTEFGFGVALVPGVEWILADWNIAGAVPLAIGVAAKGSIGLVPATGFAFGADALATLHLGFDGEDAPALCHDLDLYTAIGAGFVYIIKAGVPFGLVFPSVYLGIAWYFSENLAVYLEGVYRHGWRAVGYGGAVVGVRLLTS